MGASLLTFRGVHSVSIGAIVEIINAAVDQWRARLHTCVQADGGHFEHFL